MFAPLTPEDDNGGDQPAEPERGGAPARRRRSRTEEDPTNPAGRRLSGGPAARLPEAGPMSCHQEGRASMPEGVRVQPRRPDHPVCVAKPGPGEAEPERKPAGAWERGPGPPPDQRIGRRPRRLVSGRGSNARTRERRGCQPGPPERRKPTCPRWGWSSIPGASDRAIPRIRLKIMRKREELEFKGRDGNLSYQDPL